MQQIREKQTADGGVEAIRGVAAGGQEAERGSGSAAGAALR